MMQGMSDTATTDKPSWREALQASLPVGLGYLPAGFAFGVLAIQAGLPVWLAIAMSVLVYAGALQYAAIPMMASGAGLAAFAVTTLAINLRHVLYAMPLIPSLAKQRLARYYTVASLTDETYSLVTTMPQDKRATLWLPVSLANQGWWVAGTLIGALAGPALGEHVPNLDFALPCLFLILTIEQYRASRLWQPAAVGIVALLAARWIVPPQHVLIAALGMALAWLAIQARHELRSRA